MGEFFARVNVRVLSAIKRSLKFVHLLGGERGTMAALFLFKRQARLRVTVGTAVQQFAVTAAAAAVISTPRRSAY